MSKPASETVTFTSGETSVTLPIPLPGYDAEHRRAQTRGENASGDVYVYDKDVTTRVVTLRFRITAAQKSSLLSFYDDTVDGSLTAFTYTDHLGAAHTVRFWDDIAFVKTAGGGYHVDLLLRFDGDPD